MVVTRAVSHVCVAVCMLAFFTNRCQATACGFTTFHSMGTCTSTCPARQVADASSRECRAVNSTEIHRDGYTVNATKYEAVAFVDDSTMTVGGGSYLLTIDVISVTLNITDINGFLTNITRGGTMSTDIAGGRGASNNLVILRTVNTLPPGKHFFTVGLTLHSFTLTGTFTELVREVELWILPPARPCNSTPCLNAGICSDVEFAGVQTFSCNCTPRWSGLTCNKDMGICASEPCLNGGNCTNMGDDYSCHCVGNYTGANCETRMPCTSTPCTNGTTGMPPERPTPSHDEMLLPVIQIVLPITLAVLGVVLLVVILVVVVVVVVILRCSKTGNSNNKVGPTNESDQEKVKEKDIHVASTNQTTPHVQ